MKVVNLRTLLFFALITAVNGAGCPPGIYGPSCTQECGHCLGGYSYCHPETGSCRDGCSSGYDGDTCHNACPEGSYGLGCGKACPKNCKKRNCDPVDGNCYKVGCNSGFTGKFCTQRCPPGTYGQNCALECRCAEGCLCDSHGTCLKEGCKEQVEKKKRKKRTTGTGGAKNKKAKPAATGLMCSKMQQTFTDLKKTLNRRVKVQVWPIFYLMILASVIILVVGFMQMVSDFQREMYVRKWERENILQPLQIRAKEQEEELMKAIKDKDPTDEQEKKRCIIS